MRDHLYAPILPLARGAALVVERLFAFAFRLLACAYQYPNVPVDANFTYPSWETAFRILAAIARNQRLVMVIDEFPYAVEAESGLPSLLQRLWDHEIKQTQIYYSVHQVF